MTQLGTRSFDRPDPRRLGDEAPERIASHYVTDARMRLRILDAEPAERSGLYARAWEHVLDRTQSSPPEAQEAEAARRAHHVASQIKALAPYLKPSSRVLEIGPGDGGLSVALCGRVRAVTAVDVREDLALRSDLPPNLELVVSDGGPTPVEAGSVDLAITDQLIEHLHPDDVESLLEAVWTALRPGGLFVVLTPNRLLGPHDISRYYNHDEARGLHLHEFSFAELRRLLRAAGYVRVRPMVGGGRHWIRSSGALVSGVEATLEALPAGLRRGLIRAPAVRAALNSMLGVRALAWKP